MKENTIFAALKKQVIFRLINREKNQELLNNVPHRDLHDLSIIYNLILRENSNGILTATIRNEHMRQLELSEDELYQYAVENTPRLLPAEIHNVLDMIGDCAQERSSTDTDSHDQKNETCLNPMHAITNRRGLWGASVILYPNILAIIADVLESDLILLPSSIHEMLILPWKDNIKPVEALGKLVQFCNRTGLSPEEVLSDAVYCFKRGNTQIEILVSPNGNLALFT